MDSLLALIICSLIAQLMNALFALGHLNMQHLFNNLIIAVHVQIYTQVGIRMISIKPYTIPNVMDTFHQTQLVQVPQSQHQVHQVKLQVQVLLKLLHLLLLLGQLLVVVELQLQVAFQMIQKKIQEDYQKEER